MASRSQISSLLPPPDRTDVLNAVARCIGKIRRRHGLSAVDIARRLTQPDGNSPDPETIRRAERGDNLLQFDLAAQIAFIWPDCADDIRALFEPSASVEPTSVEDRLQRAEQEILAVRRALAEKGERE